MQPNIEIGDIVPETLAEQNAYLPRGTEPATLGYIDPVTGAYVQKGLEALPPGFNAPSPNDAENIARIRALIAAQQPEPSKNFQRINEIAQHVPGVIPAQVALAMATGYPAALAREMKFPEFADAIQYNPTSPLANDFLEILSKIGEKTGPMAEFMVPNRRARTFTPDDFRVAKEMAKTDVAMPLAEMAYNHYMENGIPIPGLPQQFNTPGALYAVKPKGGNNPMNLGSTLPLEQQGKMGEYFSESQITDPMKVFEERLKKHFGDNAVQNNKLRTAYEEYIQRIIEENANGIAYSDVNGKAMNELKRNATEVFAQAVEKARLEGGDPNVKKLYSPSEIEAAAKHHNEWLQGPMKKYVTNLMGTGLETDPILKEINNAPMAPHEIFGTRDRSDDQYIRDSAINSRERFAKEYSGGFEWNMTPELEEMVKNSSIGKRTATTPMGHYYEALIDSALYPKGSYHTPFYNNKKDFPGIEYLKTGDVINDFLSKPRDELGFKQIQNRIFNDILEGKIKDPSKLSTRTPANVVQDMIKERLAEIKALQKNTEVYHGWRQENHNTMPSDATFTDADGNNTNKKLVIFDSKIANENPELVTRNLAQETKDLNHCVGACGMNNGKYIPMVEPHTGVANKVDSSHGPRYLEQMKKGQISVASLRGPNGESKATFELNPINNKEAPTMRLVQVANGEPKYEVRHSWDSPNEKKYFDTEQEANKYIYDYITKPNQFKVSQLKGKDNKHVIGDEYINDAKNWLNYKHQTGELADFVFDDIKNLPGVHDLRSRDSLMEFAKSENPKDKQANALYDEAVRNKLKGNPQLNDEYQKGFISPVDVLSSELGRFVTADDIINKFGSK